MDKNTLSNYGWIVIAVLVLSVMIALATPFGEYVENAVWSVTEGLFDTSENALNILGMSATNTESNKATLSGLYITADDVSPTKHNLKVNLSSDTITDFSSISVSRYGSNILDATKLSSIAFVDNGDGTYTLSKTTTASGMTRHGSASIPLFIPAGTPVYAYAECVESTLNDGQTAHMIFTFDDDTYSTMPFASNDTITPTLKTFDKDVVNIYIIVVASANDFGDYITIKNLQLNIGNIYDYTEYTEPQTVTANADGSVSGMTSLSPNMVLLPNDSDVNITCEYQKKTNL